MRPQVEEAGSSQLAQVTKKEHTFNTFFFLICCLYSGTLFAFQVYPPC